jgi:PilZ domain
MRDISAGGASLETALLPLGEEIRVEIEGDCSAFTLDAVVMRSGLGPRAKGSVGIRFVDRDPGRYAEWLREECVRLSMWMCKGPVVPLGRRQRRAGWIHQSLVRASR